MKGRSFFILALIFLNVCWAQSDIRQPYSWCPQFKVQFVPQIAPMSGFKLFVPKSVDPLEWEDSQITLERKSDLISVDWMLAQKVQNFCGRLPEDCDVKVDLPIDEKFIFDIKHLLQKIPPVSNECDELAEVIVLQKEVENLKREDIFTYKKQLRLRNAYKLFSPENSKTIDLFTKCGGKKGSSQFIKNTILINLASACIIPRPPGSFSWEEAEVMASDISKDYGNISLLKMKGLEEEITQKTMRKFARELIAQQVKDYVPDVNKFIDELPYWAVLEEQLKNKDYRDTLMSLDATFGVFDQVLPYVIESQLKSKISQDQSSLMAEVQDRARKEYDRCVQPYKLKMKFGASTQERVKNYNEIKDIISKKINVSQNPCQSIPMLSETLGITDSEVLISCVYSSMTEALAPIVKAAVNKNLISEKDQGDPERLRILKAKSLEIADNGMMSLQDCLDGKFPGYHNSLMGNQSLSFVKPEASAFDVSLLTCVDNMTVDIGRETSAFVIEENIKNYYLDKSMSVSQDILHESFDPCVVALKKDSESKGTTSVDPARCEYMITVKTIEKILEGKFLKDYSNYKREIDPILSQLKACNQKGIDQFYRNIPQTTNSGGTDFTHQDIILRDCVSKAIEDVSGVIAVNTFSKRVTELGQKGDLKFKKDILKQAPYIEKSIENCLNKEFSGYKDWGAFSQVIQDSKTFDEMTHRCENQVTGVSLATIFNIESKGQIKEYESKNLFPPKTTSESVLNEVSGLIVQKNKLQVPVDLKGDERRVWIFENGYLHYLLRNPKSKDPIKGYTDYLSKLAEDTAYTKVHDNLLIKMAKMNELEAKDFKGNVDAACFERINKSFLAKLPEAEEKSTSNPLDILASNLIAGLDYLKKIDQVTYASKLQALSALCQKNPMSYDDVRKSILTEIIMKGQIFKGLETDFSQALLKGILEEKKKVKEPYRDVKLKYLDYKYNKMESLINGKLRNPKELEKILFSDGTLLKYAQDSFSLLAAGDKDTKTKFSQLMLKELFQDSKTGGFADRFAKYQLVASVGLGGVENAVDGARDSWFSYVSDSPVDSAIEFFRNPNNIESAVAWDSINENMRKRFESKIYLLGVLPKTDSAPFNTEGVENKILRTYYPAYHSSSSLSLPERIAESKLQATLEAGADHVLNRHSSELNSFNLTTESKDKYEKLKLMAESEAEAILKKDFRQITGADRIELKSYLSTQILQGVVANDGYNIVQSSGVKTRIENGITSLVKKGVTDVIDRSMKNIETGPKF